MAILLKRQALARSLSRSLIPETSTARPLIRSCSRPSPFHRTALASSTSSQSRRSYATTPSEEPKNEKNVTPAESGKQTINQNQLAKPATGFDHLYKSSSPLSPQGGGKKDANDANMSKLSPEDEKQLDKFMEDVKKGLPSALYKDVERSFREIRRYGVPKDLRELMKEMNDGKPLTLSKAARFIRIAGRLARQTVEKADEVEAKAAKQKASTNFNSNPQGQKKKKKEESGSQEGFKFGDIKWDTSTIITSAFVSYMLYRFVTPGENLKEITWQEFRTSLLDNGLVDKLVVINHSKVKVYVHRDSVAQVHPESPAVNESFHYIFTIGSVEAFERKLEAAQQELSIPNSERIPVSYANETPWTATLFSFAPTLLLLGGLYWVSRRAGGGAGGGSSGIFGMGRSRAKKFNHETDIQVRFKDVAGMDEAKTEIMEFVAFLKEPGQFQRLGAKIPRGAILSGPPGTGKTLLAKATAGECDVPFFSVSGSEFVEMFVGVGASRVRDLFANARKNTPCIIFIDEIDAIGKSRAKQTFGGGNDEREATLNQILTEMDGFNTSEQVVVLAGTNRPDVLDSALMRPGRFDRHISIDRPTIEGRKQIFAVHLRKIVTDEDMDYLTGRLAALTPGFSGADIANSCNEAALIAARGKADKVEMIHFEQAIERTIGGLEKKSRVLSPEDKRTVAYHEAGHAICGWYFRYADPLLKVSIIPRGKGTLGYAQYLPDSDVYLMSVNKLMDRMAMTLGGRVSEEIHFDTVTSGASDDFQKVTRLATAMVSNWGMSAKIGYLYFDDDRNQVQKPFSEETARTIDAEVRRIVDEAYKQCRDLLTEKKREVGLVAEELLAKEVLGREDLVRLLGKRPFEEKKDFERYFSRGTVGGGAKSAPPPPPHEGGPPEGGMPMPEAGMPPPPPLPPTPAQFRESGRL